MFGFKDLASIMLSSASNMLSSTSNLIGKSINSVGALKNFSSPVYRNDDNEFVFP